MWCGMLVLVLSDVDGDPAAFSDAAKTQIRCGISTLWDVLATQRLEGYAMLCLAVVLFEGVWVGGSLVQRGVSGETSPSEPDAATPSRKSRREASHNLG